MRMNTITEIGTKIRYLRNTLKLTHVKIEEELELPKNTLHRLETGKGCNCDSLIQILDFMYNKGYNINWIISSDRNIERGKTVDTIDKFELQRDIGKAIKELLLITDKLHQIK